MKKIQAIALVAVSMFTPPAMAAEKVPVASLLDIHGIAFDLAEAGSLFVASHDGLYKAGPDGMAEPVSQNKDDYMGFSPHPTDPKLLFSSGHPAQGGNIGVALSSDGGTTWTQIATGVGGPVDFHGMSVSRADPRTLYGLSRGIQVSRDGGMTWSLAGPGPDRVIDIAASPTKAEVLYAATLGGLMMSTDVGTTWQLLGPPNAQVSMVETAPDGSLYAYFVGSGLFRQSPADGTWEVVGSLGDKIIMQLAADPADPARLVVVTQEGEILQSRDGGTNWAPFAP